MKIKLIIPIIALILLAVSVYSQGDTCTYSGPYTDLINKHIQRYGDDVGITIQCSQSQILTRECGWCGNRIKSCRPEGIWDLTWSTCEGQGYCDPNEKLSDVLLIDTHRKENSCGNATGIIHKVEYAKTWQQKECGSACSYTNVKEVNEHVSWQCNTGYCGATCTASTNEACGRCGTSTCTNCKETCSGEGVCTAGTSKVVPCAYDDCQIVRSTCTDNCTWSSVDAKSNCIAPKDDNGCNAKTYTEKNGIPTYTKACGYCGAQTCIKKCTEEKAIYYWSDCTGEYLKEDKCSAGQQIKTSKEKRKTCEGIFTKYVDVYQNKLCPNTCKLNEATWVGNEFLENEQKVAIKGECEYKCDNEQTRYSGIGECEQIETCQNNNWVVTTPAKISTAEICGDGLDNDCNGKRDSEDEECQKIVQPYIPPEKEGCSGCNCGNPDLNGDGKIDVNDFKAFYLSNLHVCKPDNRYNPNADFNGDGCVGVQGINRDNSFGGGYTTVNNIYTNYPNPDSDCFYEKYKNYQTCNCPDLNGDGEIDISDIVRLTNKFGECNVGNLDLDGDGCIYNIQTGSQIIMGDIYCVVKDFGRAASEIEVCKLAKKANNIACTSNNDCSPGMYCIKASLAPGYQPYCCPAADNCVQANGECVPPGTESTTTQHICMPGWLWKCEADPPGTIIPNWCGASTAGLSLAGCHATAPANSKVHECMYGGSYIGKSCLINGKPTANNCFVCNEGYTWDGSKCKKPCGGFEYNGYCWYAGGAGQSCNEVCNSYGGCVAGNWNHQLDCSINEEVAGSCSICYGNTLVNWVPMRRVSDNACWTSRGTNPVTQDCSAKPVSDFVRICACNN